MSSPVPVSLALMSGMLWLDLDLLETADADVAPALLRRLERLLAGSGLRPAWVRGRMLVVAVDRPLSRLDRGMLIGWLVEQPEVAKVSFIRSALPARNASREAGHDA